ncbi:MFS transporter [Pseudosporangium ferrugineum]|uniref:Putative MFS family arabinose efflux permease n=1 Tax=Pseudosporangium ferrugineum TaxID=439699 RepID=A0A2T0S0V8_9ACTN|nr:MFS transporter [Pseudosporangium ferrugineum]PRY27064.1 putative MFS family arabinose efflux permease [Pseudosporangium ferrugineum]
MSAFAPLRHVAFRYLLAGRTVTALGNAVAPVALAFAVLDLTGSASDLGLVVGARVLANVLFLLFGGALADRLPKHLLMVGSSAAAAVTQGAVAALVLTGTATVPLLIALSAVNGMVSALAMPASSAILPQLIPADLRQQANGLNRMVFNGAFIVGAPLGGVLVATVGPGWGIGIDAIAFLIGGLCFAALRIPGAAQGEESGRSGIVADLRAGWTEFRSRTWLWVIVAAFGLINACLSGGLGVLGPLVADASVGRRAWGFVLAAETAGMVLGAFIAMRIKVRRLLFVGVLCTSFLALPLLTLGLAPHLGLLMGATFVTGLAIEQFVVAWETTMQEHVPADMLARVYSYDMVGSFIAIPIGQVVAGPIAEAVGVEPTLVGAAGLIALAVLGMLSSRDVRNLSHRPPERGRTAPEPMEELPA